MSRCERCLDTGEWFVCQYQDYCEDDCLVVGCPDCGAGTAAKPVPKTGSAL